MNKIILFVMAVVVGLFSVLVMNNRTTPEEKKEASEKLSTLSTPNQFPTTAPSAAPSDMPIPTDAETPQEPPKATISATIKTSKGNIVLTLYSIDAPNTVRNFVTKAKNGFYNNLTFHRVEDWVIQGGDPKGNGTGGGSMKVEFNTKPFVAGALGVASRGDNVTQNDAQFFITKEEASWLDGKYTNFGIVTEGMDVVNSMKIGDKILGITVE